MKYKVGDLVRIDAPYSRHNGRLTQIDRVEGGEFYKLNIDHGLMPWIDEELIGTHGDCGCNDMDEPIIEGTDKRERIAEIIKWLYINDRKFDSREQWKEELIKFLEEIL